MTIQQLKYVVALAEHRHFVQAAESCFIAQPTLTLQIKKLEEEMNITLFDRSKKPLEPTPLGLIFIDKARQILREFENLENIVKEEISTIEGIFTLGIIPTLAPYLLPRFIQRFSQQHPETYLKIQELQTEEILRRINNNTLDIAIVVTPVEEKAIKEEVLFYEPFLVFTSAQHPLYESEIVEKEKLKTPQLWLLNQGHCFRSQALKICTEQKSHSSYLQYAFEGGSIETLKNMVRHNIGYTLIPELSINDKIDQPFLRRFPDPQPVREVSLIYHNSFSKISLIHRLKDEILQSIPTAFQKARKRNRINWL